MEEIHKREQPEKDAVNGKIKLLERRYDIPKLIELLEITKEHVLYSAKKLPPGWNRKQVFNNIDYVPPVSLPHNVQKLKHTINRYTKTEVADLHAQIIASGGANSHLQCLLIRYARNLFRKNYVR